MKPIEKESVWALFMAVQVADSRSYLANVPILIDNDLERKVMLKDLQSKLSFEAKEVIRIILTAPVEVVQMMTPKTKKITKRRVLEFIAIHFFKRKAQKARSLPDVDKRTKRVMDELKEFVENF